MGGASGRLEIQSRDRRLSRHRALGQRNEHAMRRISQAAQSLEIRESAEAHRWQEAMFGSQLRAPELCIGSLSEKVEGILAAPVERVREFDAERLAEDGKIFRADHTDVIS